MRIWNTVVAICLLLSAAPSHADDRAKARALYESGTSHYNLAEYKEALENFKAAYRARRDPVFLFNIAQCYRQMGQPTEAATFYRSYRREAPDASNRNEVERLIAEMDRAIQEKRAQQPPIGTEPPSDRLSKTPEPTPEPPITTPPPPATTPPPPALVERPPPERKPITKKAWFWGTIAGAAVVIAVGVGVGVGLGTAVRDPEPTVGHAVGN